MTDIAFAPEPTRSDYVSYVGCQYGRLTVIGHAGKSGQNRRWWCRCECGTLSRVQSSDLRTGKVRSCGCLNSEVVTRRNVKHGLSKLPEYAVWVSLKDRCFNPNAPQFDDYGGRGITVCDRWAHSFEAFFSDLGPRPQKNLTVERRNGDGNYEPSNCYWAPRIIQNNNKRNNKLLTARGMTLTMAQWAEIVPTKYSTIRSRKRLGYSDEQALFGI